MSFLFKTSPKKDTERSQPYYDWLMKNIVELKESYKKELQSKLNNYPADEEDPNSNILRRHPVGNIFFELQDATKNGLSINTDIPFNFKPALKLIQICNSGENHFLRPLETKLFMVCRKQFFVVLIRKIDFVLEALRTDVTLNVTTDSQGRENDPLVLHTLGQHLLPIRSVCLNGYMLSAISTFNLETLFTLHKICQQSSFSENVKNSISQIYQMIIDDIKTPSSLLGGHFLYTHLNSDLAIVLITDFLKQEKEFEELQKKEKSDNKEPDKNSNVLQGRKNKHPLSILIAQPPKINFGELLWRIVLILNPEKLKILTDTQTTLISQMRQSVSFQTYELLKDNDQMLFKYVLQSPWIFQTFTARQLISFIYSPLSPENREILIQQNLQLKTTSNLGEISYSGKRLFISKIHLEDINLQQHTTLMPKENTKKMLLTFLVIHSKYTKKIINEIVICKEFIFTVGIYRELMPLLDPMTVINLFLEVDRYLPITIPAALNSNHDINQNESSSEIKITGNKLRNFIEYEFLLEHILENIKHGDKTYFESLLKIPYLLYELIKRETLEGKNGFLQLPAQTVLPFFAVFNVKIILDTLRLLDIQDPINNTMIVNSIEYKIDKNDTQSAFQRFAQFLMSVGFLEFRKSWLQNEEASTTLREYPFLLKDFNSNDIDNFVTKDQEQDTFMQYAELAIKNDVNSFVCCPQLLIYLTPEKIIEIHQKSSLTELLRFKEMPEKVVNHLFNNMTKLKVAIPGLEQYITQQKQNAELDSLLTPFPVIQTSRRNNPVLPLQNRAFMTVEDALATIDHDLQQQKENRERAEAQALKEQQRQKEREEYELKLKQEEEAHRINLAEYESKLEQLRKSKQEELAKLQLAHAEQKAKLEEEISLERQQWESELERMSKEKEALQKQIEAESARRKAEKEENERRATELAQLLLEEQERLLKENEQRTNELEEILQKQEAERKAYELHLKSLEEAARLKTAEYERAQKAIMDRDFANKQQELEQLKKQREAELKRRQEELERVRVEQEKQKEKIAAELRKREQEEKERQERAQQEARIRKEKVAELERKELEEEQLFQQEEEQRKKQLATLEEKKQRAIDTHILNQNKNQKAIDEILDRTKKQDEERAEIERQEAELTRAKKEMEEFRKRLKEEEAKIQREKNELQNRSKNNERIKQELDETLKKLDAESATLNKTEEELSLLKKEQLEFRKQLDEQLAQSKQQEAEHKRKLEQNECALKEQEKEFQRKVAEHKSKQHEMELALRASELEHQQLEETRLKQEKEREEKYKEKERIRKVESEQHSKRMAQLEAELRQQQGSAQDKIEAMRKEIERVAKEREQELARQQQELEQLQKEEATRKKQLEEEKQRRKVAQENQRRSVDAYSLEVKELEELRTKAAKEAEQKRQEMVIFLKKQAEENQKLEEDQRRYQRGEEERQRIQKVLAEGQQKQAAERGALKQRAEELLREKQKDEELKQKLTEQENKLLREREQRATEQERKRKEQEEARKKEEEQKRQEELRLKKAELEKQRKIEEVRKKEEERKRQEEERRKLSQSEELERQRKIEAERASLAKSDRNYKNHMQELAAQHVPPRSSSPHTTLTAASPTSTPVVAIKALSSSNAKNAATVGMFPQAPTTGSPRNGIKSPDDTEIANKPAVIPKQRDEENHSRKGKLFDPTTVAGALSSFTRDEQAVREAEEKAAAITKTPPPTPKGKGL